MSSCKNSVRRNQLCPNRFRLPVCVKKPNVINWKPRIVFEMTVSHDHMQICSFPIAVKHPSLPFLHIRHYPYMAWCKKYLTLVQLSGSDYIRPILTDHAMLFTLNKEKTANDVRHVTACCILKPTVKIVWQCMYIPPSAALPIFQQFFFNFLRAYEQV